MTIEQFVENEINKLQKFAVEWKEANKINPSNFPLELEESDWNEQVIAYTELGYSLYNQPTGE